MSYFHRNLSFLRQHKEGVDARITQEISDGLKDSTKLGEDLEKEDFPDEGDNEMDDLPDYKRRIREEVRKQQKELDENVKSFLKLREELTIRKRVLGELSSLGVGSGENLANKYETRINNELGRISFNDQYFQSHAMYKDYYRQKWDIHHDNQPLPWEDQDGDLMIVGSEVKTTCPFSQDEMLSPMKNTCGHHYSKEGVEQALRSSGGRPLQCPEVGCNAYISKNLLVLDTVLQVKIKRKLEKDEKNRQKTQTLDIV